MADLNDLIDLNTPPKIIPKTPTKNEEPIIVHEDTSFKIFNESVLNLSNVDNFSFTGRPSVLLHEAISEMNEDFGRESLGILREKDLFHISSYYPSAQFLQNRSKLSSFSSASSINSQFNNAFAALDLTEQDLFRDTIPSCLNRNIMEPIIEEDVKDRIYSLPDNLFKTCLNEEQADSKQKYKSVGYAKPSLNASIIYDIADNDDFNDSVFIEAHHLASRIADGSILNEGFEEENILDSTPHPEWDSVSDTEETSNEKCDTDKMFKTLDKLLPILVTDADNNSSTQSNNSSKNFLTPSYLLEKRNLFAVQNSQNNSKSSLTSNNSKSRDAKEILQNLSEILNNDNTDEHQKLVGISNFVELWGSGPKTFESRDDSGHSSIEEAAINSDEQPYMEIEQASKGSVSANQIKPLDLSMNQKSEKHLSKTFNNACFKVPSPVSNNLKKQMDTMKKIAPNMIRSKNSISDSKESINEAGSSSSLNTKLKAKKRVETTAKGPLKAIIPLTNVVKKDKSESSQKSPRTSKIGTLKNDKTPVRISQKQMKRTSTPINRKPPLAQSTPSNSKLGSLGKYIGSCSSNLKPRKTVSMSPLTSLTNSRETTFGELEKSDSIPSIVNNNVKCGSKPEKKTMIRRYSATDISKGNSKSQIKRSNSFGKENSQRSLK